MLTTYRRHSSDCQHFGKTRNARGTRNCSCPVWVQGSLKGEYVRRSLDLTSWEAASELVRGWEASGEIGVVKTEAPSLKDAIARFLADAEARGMRAGTVRKYRHLLEAELLPYCASKNVTRLDRVTVDFLRHFRESLPHMLSTQQKKIESQRTSFGFCMDSRWLDHNPAKKVKVKRVGLNPTMPFSEDDIERLLEACATFRGNGQRLRALIGLLRHSGLRIGDAVVLERSRIKDGRVFVYTAKTGTPVMCPLPKHILKELAALPGDRYFFWNGTSKSTTLFGKYYRAFLALSIRAKVEHPHFHRFRDSFAVSLLEKGVPLENVSILLGHSSVKVTEKHYAPWVKRRQAILEEQVRATWQIPA